MIGIYKIENKINSKVYIGASKSIKKRWNRHTSELRNNTHWNEHLQKDYNLYGVENFKYSIILECKKECLQCNENFLIDVFNSTNREWGYNIVKNNCGFPEETKRKMSERKNEALKDPKERERLRLIAKNAMTDERKIYMSNLQKNMPLSRREHLSEIMKEKMKNPEYKKMMCERSREALSKMDLRMTEEEKDRVRGSNNGMAKLKEEDVINIRKRKSTGEKRKNVYADYETLITKRGFKAVWLNQNWKHIQI